VRDGSVKCPQCGARSFVVGSRPTSDKKNTLRRRECRVCKHRFRTIEILEDEVNAIKASVKKHEGMWNSLATMLAEHGDTGGSAG
jgi:transcriptional regulator NrdR family protein